MNIKSIKWLLIGVVLVVLFWLFSQRNTTSLPEPLNTLSQTNNPPDKAASDSSTKPLKTPQLAERVNPGTTAQTAKTTDANRSYLTIYKDLELAKSCQEFSRKNHQAKGEYDYISPLNNAANLLNQDRQGATEEQKQAQENFVSACLNLRAAVFQRAGITTEFVAGPFTAPVQKELRQELKQTKPQSDEEQHLAKTIQLASQWQSSYAQVIDVLRGQPKLAKPVRDMLVSEAQAIQAQINNRYQSTDVINPEDIQQLEQQIKNLYDQTSERLPVNEATKQQAIANFKPTNAMMEQQLFTIYPESFKKAVQLLQVKGEYDLKAQELFGNSSLSYTLKLMPGYQPPSRVLQEIAQIDDHQIFNLLIGPASLLYLCYLGDDCSAESVHVKNYCLGKHEFFIGSHPKACGKSLIDFFTADYLSPNQWQDVNDLFDIMVATYAP